MTEPLAVPQQPTVPHKVETAGAEVAAYVEAGSPAFWRINFALFGAGFATFAMLYYVQPLMPVFAAVFRLSPARSSLSLSVATALLAVSMLVAGSLSEAWGRKPVMLASLLLAGALTVLAAAAPTFPLILLLRGLAGIALGGLPAVAMAYLAEEINPKAIGLVMGLYVGGNAVGGMCGRLVTGVLTDLAGWRAAVLAIGLLGLLAAVVLWRGLPPSRHFCARRLRAGDLASSFIRHLRSPALPALFAEGFLLMGGFVTIYNYIGFRRLAAPYDLDQTAVGLLFSVYLVGVLSSASMGALSSRIGRRPVLWGNLAVMLAGVGCTLGRPLGLIVPGIALVTWGFFGAHAVASAWVGAEARGARAQAASLYLFAYYAGSSIVGTLGGLAWARFGWPGIAGLVGALLAVALALPISLPAARPTRPMQSEPPRRRKPLA